MDHNVKLSPQAFKSLLNRIKEDTGIKDSSNIVYVDYQYNSIQQAMLLGCKGILAEHHLNANIPDITRISCTACLKNLDELLEITQNIFMQHDSTNVTPQKYPTLKLGSVADGNENDDRQNVTFGDFSDTTSNEKDSSDQTTYTLHENNMTVPSKPTTSCNKSEIYLAPHKRQRAQSNDMDIKDPSTEKRIAP